MCVFFWNASVVGEIVPHASPKVIFRTDNSGIGFLCAPRRAPSGDGTTLKIADREYLPESTQSDDALAAFYATDMTLGQILPYSRGFSGIYRSTVIDLVDQQRKRLLIRVCARHHFGMLQA
jgi:hypothetical protein